MKFYVITLNLKLRGVNMHAWAYFSESSQGTLVDQILLLMKKYGLK